MKKLTKTQIKILNFGFRSFKLNGGSIEKAVLGLAEMGLVRVVIESNSNGYKYGLVYIIKK